MEPLVEEEQSFLFNPVTAVLQFLAAYGWYVVGGAAVALYAAQRLRPRLQRRRQQQEDAEYHKDPDKALARMEAIQRAREAQQKLMREASERAIARELERQKKKRLEAAELLQKQGAAAGQRLGAQSDDYMPLSGGASSSSYHPPKRSKCGGGGCGR